LAAKNRGLQPSWVNERFYEKVVKVKADVAALLNFLSDDGAIVGW
jgi:hypothetical protein